MKTIRLLFGSAVVFFMAFAPLSAKAHKGHNLHHGHGMYTPYWVPNHIVRAEIRHVYFPEFEIYFDRWNGTYLYFTGRRWVSSIYRPYGLRSIDFARSYKVGLAIDSPRPFVYDTRHRSNYSRYYRNNGLSHSNGHAYGYGKKKGKHHGHQKRGKRSEEWERDDDRRDNDRWQSNDNRRVRRRN